MMQVVAINLEVEKIVYRMPQVLLAPEVTLGRLRRCVSK